MLGTPFLYCNHATYAATAVYNWVHTWLSCFDILSKSSVVLRAFLTWALGLWMPFLSNSVKLQYLSALVAVEDKWGRERGGASGLVAWLEKLPEEVWVLLLLIGGRYCTGPCLFSMLEREISTKDQGKCVLTCTVSDAWGCVSIATIAITSSSSADSAKVLSNSRSIEQVVLVLSISAIAL